MSCNNKCSNLLRDNLDWTRVLLSYMPNSETCLKQTTFCFDKLVDGVYYKGSLKKENMIIIT